MKRALIRTYPSPCVVFQQIRQFFPPTQLGVQDAKFSSVLPCFLAAFQNQNVAFVSCCESFPGHTSPFLATPTHPELVAPSTSHTSCSSKPWHLFSPINLGGRLYGSACGCGGQHNAEQNATTAHTHRRGVILRFTARSEAHEVQLWAFAEELDRWGQTTLMRLDDIAALKAKVKSLETEVLFLKHEL